MSLQQDMEALALKFAQDMMTRLRTASIEELTGGSSVKASTKTKVSSTGRRPRRTDEEIAGVIQQIVAEVNKHPDGVPAETIRSTLNIEKAEFTKPLMEALEQGVIRKEGEKRATVYFPSNGKKIVKEASSKKKSGKKKKAKKEAEANGFDHSLPSDSVPDIEPTVTIDD
jgi:hypothetical protein